MKENKRKHLQELLEAFDSAMLITRHGDEAHARPMAIAGIEGPTVLWFVTSDDSPKADEIRYDSAAVVTAQSGRRFAARPTVHRITLRISHENNLETA
ncbi:MAG: pyridoxamine 5'-phosphate oxidase family protein [Polyangiaceae bacterium]|jgi:general stress protein 26